MTDCRAYFVGLDGHYVGFEHLACVDDEAAIQQARTLPHTGDIELWCGSRFLIRLSRRPD